MSRKKRILFLLFFFCVFGLLYLLLWPTEINPAGWTPQPIPVLTGDYASNNRLENIQTVALPISQGPEDVAVDLQQRVYTGLDNGTILRFLPDGTSETFANTGGRPLGMHFDAQENLIVADSDKGLLSVSPQGTITVLVSEIEGEKLQFTNDVDIAQDGTIYFTVSSRFGVRNYKSDLLESRPHGRLFSYTPQTKQVELLLKELYFPNGVALSVDQSFLLICETSRYRIQRYWLTGPQKKTLEIFLENLPGFPDGISCNRKDLFWLAMASPRDALLDQISPSPFLKKVVARLPEFVQPAPQKYGMVFGIDMNGKIQSNLQDPQGTHIFAVSSVEQVGQKLYLGSFLARNFGIFDLSK